MNQLAPHYTDEKTGFAYNLVGDYYLPDFALELEAAADEESEYEIFGWGLQRKYYLKNHHKGLYSQLLMSGKLNAHLHEIDETATDRMILIAKQMAEREGATEQLKSDNQLLWIQKMSNIHNRVSGMIREELIYS
jgi:hypothetical protein